MNGPVIEKVAQAPWEGARQGAPESHRVFAADGVLHAGVRGVGEPCRPRRAIARLREPSGYWTDTVTIYTGMIIFLGSMLVLVLIDSARSPVKALFSKTWLAGRGSFSCCFS